MCREIGYSLCIFSINHDVDNNTALAAFRDIPPKSVLLFEDIDCLFEKRASTNDNKSSFTFSHLLYLLDGVFFRKGLISFITTNHPENLDHALLRQGRTDMIIHPTRGPLVLEINTIPGMTDTSDLPAQARCAGIEFDDLVEQILTNALMPESMR